MQPSNTSGEEPRPRLLPGESIIFLGDHTSPDAEGYVRIVRDVLARFHPDLRTNLISAGSAGQTAASLGSRALLDLLLSSRPDWLAVGIGLADAMKDPGLPNAVAAYNQHMTVTTDEDATFGRDMSSATNGRREVPIEVPRIEEYEQALTMAVDAMRAGGLRPVLLTTVLVGGDLDYPLNRILKVYNRSIRSVAKSLHLPLIDVERACRDVLLRANQYKQKVNLAGLRGQITPQGDALLARTFLQKFDVLPYPGFRSSR